MSQKIYIISDMHFGHANIIKYGNRPFKDKYEMDEVITSNWNKVIKKEYYVFVLGDVSLYGKDRTKEIISKLNGRKYLIMGNHDRSKSIKYWLEVGFECISKYPVCIDEFYWFSHEPMYLNSYMPYINIHGHMHSNIIDSNQYYNVSVERIGYKPIDFDIIKNFYINERRNHGNNCSN